MRSPSCVPIMLSLIFVCMLACASAAEVKVVGSRLYVDGAPFLVKSVGYAPVPQGVDATVTPPYGDYFTSTYNATWRRDLPIIKDLGANAVKLWGWDNTADHTAFLDACEKAKLWVIPTFFISVGVYPDLNNYSKIHHDFTQFLEGINDHPSVLFYNLGSDLNADWNYGSQLGLLFYNLNLLAAHVKSISSNPRPTTTALNDQNSVSTIKTYNQDTELDLWSVNVYRGCNFGTLFKDFQVASDKPLFISEFGIDAWNDLNNMLDETLQSECYVGLWGDLERNLNVSAGAAVTEYSDEFWKSKLAQSDTRHPGCPSYNASLHSACGYSNDNFPDKYANQAWFGIVDPSFKPRLVYNQLQELWKF